MILLFSSCDKEESTAPQLKGTLVGWVTLYDEYGNKITDRSGVLITIEGTNPQITAITDSTGKYQIDNLPEGTYNIICTKNSFDTIKTIGFSFVGGNEPRIQNITLTQPSTTVISDISVEKDTVYEINNTNIMKFTISTSSQTLEYIFIRYFLSTSPNVSCRNYQYSSGFEIVDSSSNKQQYSIYTGNYIFPSGTKVYLIAYGDTNSDIGYFNINSGLIIYPALNSKGSNIASFVIF